MAGTPPTVQGQVAAERLCIHCGLRYRRTGSNDADSNLLCVACRQSLPYRERHNFIVRYATVVQAEFPGRSVALGQQIDDPWPTGFPILNPAPVP